MESSDPAPTPAPTAPPAPTPSPATIEAPIAEGQELSQLQRADALVKNLDEREARLNSKIADFEKMLAERILSGRADFVPVKSQDEKDDDEVEKTLKSYDY